MAQRQSGPWPPGDVRGMTQRFLTDVVVCDDYVIREGRIIPHGTIRTRYHPERCPELPQQLARVSRGDTIAALAFVRTYGLLGYAQVAAAVGHRAPRDTPGDPLSWLWAQAETVALCLLLTYGLQSGGRCHAAARLTRGTPPAAPSRRRGATADHPGGLGSAPGPRLLVLAAAQPRGLADVCPCHPARDPECPSAGGPSAAGGWGGHGSPRLPVSGSPGCGLLASPPHRHAGGCPALCRGVVSGVFCADATHAAVLSPRGACAPQPVCGPRPAAGRVAAQGALATTGAQALAVAHPVVRHGAPGVGVFGGQRQAVRPQRSVIASARMGCHGRGHVHGREACAYQEKDR